MSAPTTSGKGNLRRKALAHYARVAEQQKAAAAKLAATPPTTATAPTPARSAAQIVPQPVAPAPSAPPPTPATPPPATASDPTGILATYRSLTGAEGIRFFLEHEKEIRAARAGVALDSGKFPNLHGLDRVVANVRLPKP
jgi:hypothetical protein